MDSAPDSEPREIEAQARAGAICRRNGEYFLALGRGSVSDLEFDLGGVTWLDAYIERSRPHLTADFIDEFIELAGSFFGECLVAALNGRWAQSDGILGVRIDATTGVVPFDAVARQVRGEADASVTAAYHGVLDYYLGAIPHQLAS